MFKMFNAWFKGYESCSRQFLDKISQNVQNAVFKAAIKCNVQATWAIIFFIPRPFDVCVPLWARRPMLRLLTDGQPSLCVCPALHMGGLCAFFKTKKGRKKW